MLDFILFLVHSRGQIDYGTSSQTQYINSVIGQQAVHIIKPTTLAKFALVDTVNDRIVISGIIL